MLYLKNLTPQLKNGFILIKANVKEWEFNN